MELVDGAELVERVFGRWPSFHDAEVVSIALDRKAPGSSRGPTIRFSVHAFQWTDEVDSRGTYVSGSHVLVTFALHSAEVLRLEGFNQQNVLSCIAFSKPADPEHSVRVELESLYGVSACFECARAEVVSVEPYEPPRAG